METMISLVAGRRLRSLNFCQYPPNHSLVGSLLSRHGGTYRARTNRSGDAPFNLSMVTPT